MGNARMLSQAARSTGFAVHGGINAPYIWVETQPGKTSWQTFDWMFRELNVVITPGSGFGSRGDGFFRTSAFNSRAKAGEAPRRLRETSSNQKQISATHPPPLRTGPAGPNSRRSRSE